MEEAKEEVAVAGQEARARAFAHGTEPGLQGDEGQSLPGEVSLLTPDSPPALKPISMELACHIIPGSLTEVSLLAWNPCIAECGLQNLGKIPQLGFARCLGFVHSGRYFLLWLVLDIALEFVLYGSVIEVYGRQCSKQVFSMFFEMSLSKNLHFVDVLPSNILVPQKLLADAFALITKLEDHCYYRR